MKMTVKLELEEKAKRAQLFWTGEVDCFIPNPVVCIQRPNHSGMHCRQAQPESYMSTTRLPVAVLSVPPFSLFFCTSI